MIRKAKKHAWKYRWPLLVLAVWCAVLLWGPTAYAKITTRHERYDIAHNPVDTIPKRHVAIVFGAGLYDHDKPTSYLRTRVEAAVKLYQAGRVDKLLMSGDNSTKDYNEPKAMRKLAMKLGVPPQDIVLDYAGRNTYDSCYRARHIFDITSATMVSQGYHLPRTIMTCRGLGIDAIGVGASHLHRDYTVSYIIREWISTDKAAVELLFKPKPALLGPTLPIR